MHLRPALLLGTLAVAAVAVLASADSGDVLLPTARAIQPAGHRTPLAVFPTGAAVSADGSLTVAIAGQHLEGSSGRSVLVESLNASGLVTGVVSVQDAFQGVVLSADDKTAYVAGGSQHVIHVLPIGPAGVRPGSTIAVNGFVSGLALSPDGHTLWAASSDIGQVSRVDLATATVTGTLHVPGADQLALNPSGTALYASDWHGHTVTPIDTGTFSTGAPLSVGNHPEGMAVLADGSLVVADAGDATLATFRPGSSTAVYTDVGLPGLRGSDAPSEVRASSDGRHLYVTLGGDDAVEVLSVQRPSDHDGEGSGGEDGDQHADADARSEHGAERETSKRQDSPWRVDGYVPTGWCPVDVQLSKAGLTVVTAKGLGTSQVAVGSTVDPTSVGVDSSYLTAGDLETLPIPGEQSLQAMTAQVRRTVAVARESDSVVLSPHGPIKHVIYITRENKTYDADLGDLHPGPGAALTLFGRQVTPNLHALETGFVEAQHFYYPGWRSTVGHMWEDAGGTSDTYERAVGSQSTSSSWSDPENYPKTGLLVAQALHAGRSVRTYNEELAQQSGLFPAQFQAPTSVFPNYDLKVSDTSRELGWEREFRQFAAHDCKDSELVAAYGHDCDLPSLEYVYLGEDHTTTVDEPGYPTVEAQVADNDYATARVVETVSQSHLWDSTLVVVVEDDPQGTGDDVSAYRGFIAMASPWVKRGVVSQTPYSLPCVVGAIDRVLGLPPLTGAVATCDPLSELFTDRPDPTPFMADGSGVARFPFTPLPGMPPTSDLAHGVLSFATPDATIPSVAQAATRRQVLGR